ncbi:MAG: hypothetical protein FWF01_04485 [Alphaproteobacteria bacterium]|nr:hypothetical protein [Alphaproteobacteria bacterium]
MGKRNQTKEEELAELIEIMFLKADEGYSMKERYSAVKNADVETLEEVIIGFDEYSRFGDSYYNKAGRILLNGMFGCDYADDKPMFDQCPEKLPVLARTLPHVKDICQRMPSCQELDFRGTLVYGGEEFFKHIVYSHRSELLYPGYNTEKTLARNREIIDETPALPAADTFTCKTLCGACCFGQLSACQSMGMENRAL